MGLMTHQYIERRTGDVHTERLFGDRLVNFLYSGVRENAPTVFKALTSARISNLLGLLNFEAFLGCRLRSARDLLRSWGVDVSECVDEPEELDTPAKVFTRKIRYWRCRPMADNLRAVVSPADSRLLLGSFARNSLLFVKDKFFDFNELLGETKTRWLTAFKGGDYAVFRLTPEKYHYVHTPVTGRVVDCYELPGQYHSCNPGAVVNLVHAYCKNKRVVTVIDTDVEGGTGVGLVAVVEVVALMVGDIEQCYSEKEYQDPQAVISGMFLQKGQPKSVFRPGSSTVVLLFSPRRLFFDPDLVANQRAGWVKSRFSEGFGRPLVETDVNVRTQVGLAKKEIIR
ncbi:MAG: phosphatidylserine decarboxylase [Desulfarculaceae bacterium]|jgi:phosphatidylserine decarboxylase